MASFVDVAILSAAIMISALIHIFAYILLKSLTELQMKMKDIHTSIQYCLNIFGASEISNSVLQLCADKLKVDADVNDFEKTCMVLKLEDFRMPYKQETMIRINKPKAGLAFAEGKQPKAEEDGEEEDPKTKKNGKKEHNSEPKKSKKSEKKVKEEIAAKKEESKGTDTDLFEKPKGEELKAASKDPNYQTLVGIDNEKVFGENKKKEKFKAPANVAKAEPKDPAYETLAGLGNELFEDDPKKSKENNEKKDDKKEKKEEKKDDEKKPDKKKFKEPEKIRKAEPKDPQYETLAEVKDDIFKE